MTGGQPKEKFAMAIGAFESTLKLKPDYHQAMLYIVEIYGTVPEDKGGDKKQGKALFKEAEALDPYFSKATVSPVPDLFIRPDEISHNHRYLFRPF